MRRRAYGTGLRALACALLAWHVWLVWHAASYEAADVEWTCDSQGCSSDSFAAGAPLLGIATGAVLGLLATRFLRRAAGGAVAVFCALACIVGWHDARGARGGGPPPPPPPGPPPRPAPPPPPAPGGRAGGGRGAGPGRAPAAGTPAGRGGGPPTTRSPPSTSCCRSPRTPSPTG
ncbi:hypothetical protein AAHZ94_01865 [Streptomyces sp. HSW2009]|uniref:hypothetical protein n=1 Tax=Streptomyces sp. HSW2009 TaxID=3142890 RepID=UPI0032F0255F